MVNTQTTASELATRRLRLEFGHLVVWFAMTGEQSTRSMGSMGGQGKHRVHALESSLEPGPVQIQ